MLLKVVVTTYGLLDTAAVSSMITSQLSEKTEASRHSRESKHQYTLFFCKNVVFPAQAEYSYFFADFRLEIFLYYS